jgi:hypothetical protein
MESAAARRISASFATMSGVSSFRSGRTARSPAGEAVDDSTIVWNPTHCRGWSCPIGCRARKNIRFPYPRRCYERGIHGRSIEMPKCPSKSRPTIRLYDWYCSCPIAGAIWTRRHDHAAAGGGPASVASSSSAETSPLHTSAMSRRMVGRFDSMYLRATRCLRSLVSACRRNR